MHSECGIGDGLNSVTVGKWNRLLVWDVGVFRVASPPPPHIPILFLSTTISIDLALPRYTSPPEHTDTARLTLSTSTSLGSTLLLERSTLFDHPSHPSKPYLDASNTQGQIKMFNPLAAVRDALTNTSKSSQADYIPLAHTPTEKDTPTTERDTYITPASTPEQPSRLRVIFTVSFHICSALSVTLLNKWALNNIPLPQVLLAFQSGICVILSVVIKMFGVGNVGHLALPMGEIQKLWVYLFMRTLGVGMKVWCLNVSRLSHPKSLAPLAVR